MIADRWLSILITSARNAFLAYILTGMMLSEDILLVNIAKLDVEVKINI